MPHRAASGTTCTLLFKITLWTPRFYTSHYGDPASRRVSRDEVWVDIDATYEVKALILTRFLAVAFETRGTTLWVNVDAFRRDGSPSSWARLV